MVKGRPRTIGGMLTDVPAQAWVGLAGVAEKSGWLLDITDLRLVVVVGLGVELRDVLASVARVE